MSAQYALQLIESLENDLEEIRFNILNEATINYSDWLDTLLNKIQELKQLIYEIHKNK